MTRSEARTLPTVWGSRTAEKMGEAELVIEAVFLGRDMSGYSFDSTNPTGAASAESHASRMVLR